MIILYKKRLTYNLARVYDSLGSDKVSRVPLDNTHCIALHIFQNLQKSFFEGVELFLLNFYIAGSFRAYPPDHSTINLGCKSFHDFSSILKVYFPVYSHFGSLDEHQGRGFKYFEYGNLFGKVIFDETVGDPLLELSTTADVGI